MSCTADAGGHYYAGAVTSDPWTSISYTSAADGSSSGTESVDTGGESADVAGRTMIIHDHGGGRVACAILGAVTQVPLTAAGFVKYYSYAGDLAVAGTVGPMTTAGTAQSFAYQISRS